MMDSLKNKIVKLENNKEYFVLETLIDNNINYMLLWECSTPNFLKQGGGG